MNRYFALLFLLILAAGVWMGVALLKKKGRQEWSDMRRFRAVAPQLAKVLPPTARLVLGGNAASTERLVKLRHWMPPRLLFISSRDAMDTTLLLDFADSPLNQSSRHVFWSVRDDAYTYRLVLPQ